MKMNGWRRWQDWVNLGVGIWLFVSPWVLGLGGVLSVACSGVLLGILISAVSLWALASPESGIPQWCNVQLGTAAVLVPLVLRFFNQIGPDQVGPILSFTASGLIVMCMCLWARSEKVGKTDSEPAVRHESEGDQPSPIRERQTSEV